MIWRTLRPTLLFFVLFPFHLLPLQLRKLILHLLNQHLELLLTLLAGMGVDIAGVLLAVDPHRRVAAFKKVVIDLADTSCACPAAIAHIRLEIGHSQFFRLGWGHSLSQLRIVLLQRCFADAAVNIGSGGSLHIVGNVGVNIQRSRRRHMAQYGGESLHIHAVLQSQR